eukprot:scaffold676_cov273-Pinguiococcus_pyrenoidosus.AAC.2
MRGQHGGSMRLSTQRRSGVDGGSEGLMRRFFGQICTSRRLLQHLLKLRGANVHRGASGLWLHGTGVFRFGCRGLFSGNFGFHAIFRAFLSQIRAFPPQIPRFDAFGSSGLIWRPRLHTGALDHDGHGRLCRHLRPVRRQKQHFGAFGLRPAHGRFGALSQVPQEAFELFAVLRLSTRLRRQAQRGGRRRLKCRGLSGVAVHIQRLHLRQLWRCRQAGHALRRPVVHHEEPHGQSSAGGGRGDARRCAWRCAVSIVIWKAALWRHEGTESFLKAAREEKS